MWSMLLPEISREWMVEWEGCRNRVHWPEILFTLEYSIRIPIDVMHRRYPDRQDLLTLDTLMQ